MTQIISDIRILDNLLALNLDISLWSARKKMTVEDFGGAELPPEDLASLGSKRIADPSSLKIFSTLKARAFSFLDRHGVRFMSGWAIPEEKAGAIIQELVAIRDEFLREKEAFLADYDESVKAWIDKHSQWSEIIRDSTVSPEYVRARMDFRWQLYKVSPWSSILMKRQFWNLVWRKKWKGSVTLFSMICPGLQRISGSVFTREGQK